MAPTSKEIIMKHKLRSISLAYFKYEYIEMIIWFNFNWTSSISEKSDLTLRKDAANDSFINIQILLKI